MKEFDCPECKRISEQAMRRWSADEAGATQNEGAWPNPETNAAAAKRRATGGRWRVFEVN